LLYTHFIENNFLEFIRKIKSSSDWKKVGALRRGTLDNLTMTSFLEVVKVGELPRRSLNTLYLTVKVCASWFLLT